MWEGERRTTKDRRKGNGWKGGWKDTKKNVEQVKKKKKKSELFVGWTELVIDFFLGAKNVAVI